MRAEPSTRAEFTNPNLKRLGVVISTLLLSGCINADLSVIQQKIEENKSSQSQTSQSNTSASIQSALAPTTLKIEHSDDANLTSPAQILVGACQEFKIKFLNSNGILTSPTSDTQLNVSFLASPSTPTGSQTFIYSDASCMIPFSSPLSIAADSRPELSFYFKSSIQNSSSAQAFPWSFALEGSASFNTPTESIQLVAQPLSLKIHHIQIATGTDHTCSLVNEKIWCWGQNGLGQLGNGTTSSSTIPVAVDLSELPTDSKFIKIAVGNKTSCALLRNGSVQCWGNNQEGQLGANLDPSLQSPPGTFPNLFKSTPVRTFGLTNNVTALAMGSLSACAIQNGQIYCWGKNETQLLGNSTVLFQKKPTAYFSTSMTTAVDVSLTGANPPNGSNPSNGATACVQFLEGEKIKIKCWGSNAAGELGNNSFGSASGTLTSCVLLSDGSCLENIKKFALGGGIYQESPPNPTTGGHGCALLSDGNLKCWGKNVQGQAGSVCSSNTCKKTIASDLDDPVLSDLSNNVLDITSGFFHSCALKINGDIKCWGTMPTYSGLDRALGLSQGSGNNQHDCAIVKEAARLRIKCWGNNGSGQLGDNDTSKTLVDLPIPGE